jgi:hypothetical protein
MNSIATSMEHAARDFKDLQLPLRLLLVFSGSYLGFVLFLMIDPFHWETEEENHIPLIHMINTGIYILLVLFCLAWYTREINIIVRVIRGELQKSIAQQLKTSGIEVSVIGSGWIKFSLAPNAGSYSPVRV